MNKAESFFIARFGSWIFFGDRPDVEHADLFGAGDDRDCCHWYLDRCVDRAAPVPGDRSAGWGADGALRGAGRGDGHRLHHCVQCTTFGADRHRADHRARRVHPSLALCRAGRGDRVAAIVAQSGGCRDQFGAESWPCFCPGDCKADPAWHSGGGDDEFHYGDE